MFYRLQINHRITGNGGTVYEYPVPDVSAINGAKYNKDLTECVCFYPDTISGEGVVPITEEEYRSYPQCTISSDSATIPANGVTKATVTVKLPVPINEQVVLYDGEDVIGVGQAVEGMAVFEITSSLARIFRLRAESDHYKISSEHFVKAV